MIKISKLFIPYIILLIVLGFKGKLVISFVFVFLHELMHYLTARILGFSGFDIEILPVGAVLKLKDLDEANAKEDLIISLSGPLLNLVLAFIFYILFIIFKRPYFDLIFNSNLAIGIFNLIPAFPLDGGRVLRDILSFNNIYRRANEITIRVSMILGSVFMFIYFVSVSANRGNFNLGLISIFILISSIKEKERIVYLIMGYIIKKKYRFIKRGYVENRSISIFCEKSLLYVLGIIDKNKYNLFTVLDENMRVIETLYEEEIIEAIKTYGNISLNEYIDIKKLKHIL
ncbi:MULTISPECIES: M50 family metallopeptidase [Clostridium]|uniref:M50 family metallopeptidase n=1 Tax=Clostridium frigoriphilum TaxID=443253 RepID=A0ABU7UI95_9CLOT|nr:MULTISPECIES: M50 family metallopeptidase [Clostridium]MBU3098436.1 M50 family metallopeptidase [Clostridium sp. DSM 17811]MCB2306558.1 M50 family metallopeptidase [Clostridium estertheticum]MCB2345146.1 M50 family metallopeptidase [Clostridium estertheticum]MCB2350080.1 M50 family metallopeptidase [Clostridium estertheticum]WAG44327.1 M50 family metallopeptidase [Clostridium estertheticum]